MTNMLWYRDTATGDVEVKEFGVTGAALLATGIVDDATAVNGANIRALDFGSILRNSKYNLKLAAAS